MLWPAGSVNTRDQPLTVAVPVLVMVICDVRPVFQALIVSVTRHAPEAGPVGGVGVGGAGGGGAVVGGAVVGGAVVGGAVVGGGVAAPLSAVATALYAGLGW